MIGFNDENLSKAKLKIEQFLTQETVAEAIQETVAETIQETVAETIQLSDNSIISTAF